MVTSRTAVALSVVLAGGAFFACAQPYPPGGTAGNPVDGGVAPLATTVAATTSTAAPTDTATATPTPSSTTDPAAADASGPTETEHGVPDQYTACSTDTDCAVVPRNGCCQNGWNVAVASSQAQAYTASFTCTQRRPCPQYRVRDTRVAKCNAISHCEMVKGP